MFLTFSFFNWVCKSNELHEAALRELKVGYIRVLKFFYDSEKFDCKLEVDKKPDSSVKAYLKFWYFWCCCIYLFNKFLKVPETLLPRAHVVIFLIIA